MTTLPLVSVVIPTYNNSKYIVESVNSILKQTYRNYEIIIVDDGSTDNTKIVLDRYIKKQKILYYYQENSGPSKARNYGVLKSKGKYIAFNDADDIWVRQKLEWQVDFLEKNSDYALVKGGAENITEDNKHVSFSINKNFPGNRVKLLKKHFYGGVSASTPTILIRKSVFSNVGGFPEDLSSREDHYFFMLVANSYNIKYLERVLFKRRIRKDSISSVSKIEHFWVKPLPFIEKSVQKFPFLNANRVYSKNITDQSNYCLKQDQKLKSISYSLLALKYNVFNSRAWLSLVIGIIPFLKWGNIKKIRSRLFQ